jgi:mannose-6-phosphate isomerase-like protein (cupin superfamily)
MRTDLPTRAKTYPYTVDNGLGETLTFLGIARDADGERMEIEGTARPGAGPPMHVHYLQDEVVRVVRGRFGYQVLGGPPLFAGPGESVVWPAGTPHKWWNAGEDELHATGWCRPPGNIEFYLSTLFTSAKAHGGRPGLFDTAFLARRYRMEFALLEMPAFVTRIVLPVVYALGMMLGTYRTFADAPAPMEARGR